MELKPKRRYYYKDKLTYIELCTHSLSSYEHNICFMQLLFENHFNKLRYDSGIRHHSFM